MRILNAIILTGLTSEDKKPNDACDYDTNGDGTRDGNWAIEWQNSHAQGYRLVQLFGGTYPACKCQPESICRLVALGTARRMER